MFTFIDNYKARKLLSRLYATYEKLEKAKLDYTEDNSEIYNIGVSKFNLDLSTQAAYFDQVKYTISDFTHLKDGTQLWKLTKPDKSEGTLFTTKSNYLLSGLREIHTYFGISAQQDLYRDILNPSTKLADYIQKALRHSHTKAQDKLTSDWWLSIDGDPSLLPSVTEEAYWLSLYLPEKKSTYIDRFHLNTDVLAYMAKYYHTNLIIKEY